MKSKKEKHPAKRSLWFKCFKVILLPFIRKPRFVYLGEQFADKALVVSNHIGAKAPLTFELYFPKLFRFWGTYEMNSSLKEVYKYLSEVYYGRKKHWNIVASKLFCLIAAPLAYLFYRGLKLISTYPDYRFKNTLKETVKTLEYDCNIIVFPEDSSNGYFDEITEFFAGFITLAKYCYRQGMDLPIYVTYLRRKEGVYIIDKPIKTSELLATGLSKYELAEKLRSRCNELGAIPLEEFENQNN